MQQQHQAKTDSSPQAIGGRVRAMRKSKGWITQKLADEIHITRSNLCSKESGTWAFSTEEIVRLSEVFGVTTDYILTGIRAENRPAAAALGLSDAALQALRSRDPDLMNILDYMLSRKAGRDILSVLWWYICTDYGSGLEFYGADGEKLPVTSWGAWGMDRAGNGMLMQGDINSKNAYWGNIPAAVDKEHLERIMDALRRLKEIYQAEITAEPKKKGGRSHAKEE